jgi:ribosomal protein S18 acetylase RimI-like enzyme
MIIRNARPADLPALQKLLDQLGYTLDDAEVGRRLGRVCAEAGHRVMVAEVEREVVGLLHVFERPALEKPCEAVVQSLVVEQAWRRRGVGEALMRKAEAWATDRGLSSTVLYTRIDRERARAFYERLGYQLRATSHLMGR